eukprot:scaffold8637_cov153-Skeletonema_dohrnii-CCMP3373.AAC.12
MDLCDGLTNPILFASPTNLLGTARHRIPSHEESTPSSSEQERKNADLSDYVESSELATSRKQEAEFELSLLQVASRVADIHNNMGVVHDDDPDVDRTMSNVKRMKKACASEEQRMALHGKATSIAKQTRSSFSASRNKALK